jgi:hypothetical protein
MDKKDSNYDIFDILQFNINIDDEIYLIKIYPSKDNITIIFKIEKEKIKTYYYYEKFDLRDFKQKNKIFINDENIKEVFITLKNIIDKSSKTLVTNLYKSVIKFSKENEFVIDFTLRKKIISQNRLNPILINQIEDTNNGIDLLTKHMAKINTNIEKQKNIIEGIKSNIVNINNNLKNLKSDIQSIFDLTKKMSKRNDKNNINKNEFKKLNNNQENKDNEETFLCFENLKLNRNGILLLLFLFNIITLLVASNILTSINKMKCQLGVEKINEKEFNKKLKIMNVLNEFSMGSFDIIKTKIKKRLNIKDKINGNNKRKMYEKNDNLLLEKNNKNNIEYRKSNITNNGNINSKKVKSKVDDDNQSNNFYSKNVSILKESEGYFNKKRNQASDDLLLKISKSHYLRVSLKLIFFLDFFLWRFFE